MTSAQLQAVADADPAHYQELVKRGREARERADAVQWVEGDLALEVEALPAYEGPRGPGGQFVVGSRLLRRYADDVDIEYSTLLEYRRTAEAWPMPTRVGVVPWKVHQALAAQEDRHKLIRPGLTVRAARQIVHSRRRATSGNKPGWHELIGQVGDDLIKADGDLRRLEAEINRQPNEGFRTKAGRYRGWAEQLAERLRRLEEWPQGSSAADVLVDAEQLPGRVDRIGKAA